MKIGYARVSTADQHLDLQLTELKKHGCELIFQEKISGKNTERPELQKMLAQLRKGDQVVVWKLDRIGRSIKDLIGLVEDFKNRGVDFISLHNQIDTSTPTGRFTFNLFAALAELEREIIIERTRAGLQAARERGNVSGRKPGLSDSNKKKAAQAYRLFNDTKMSHKEIADLLKIGKSTVYRYITQQQKAEAQKKGYSPEFVKSTLEASKSAERGDVTRISNAKDIWPDIL